MTREQGVGLLSRRTRQLVRATGLIYAGLFAAYGLGVSSGSLPGIDDVDLIVSGLLAVIWLALGWWQYQDTEGSLASRLPILLAYFGLSIVYLLFIVGLEEAFSILISILMATAGLRYMWRGFWAGVTTLVVTAAIYGLFYIQTVEQLIDVVIAVTMIIFIGLSVTLSMRQTLKDQRELDLSRDQVSLQRDRTTTLINNLADAVISTNRNGTITLYNAAALNLLDTNSTLEGENIDTVLNLVDTENQAVSLSDLISEAKAVTVRDDLVTLVSGEPVRLEITYAPIRRSYSGNIDQKSGYIFILRDITKDKSLEEERDEFISVVSHELRTPITIAEGSVSNAQLMLSRKDISGDRVREAIDTAHDQILFLARMVNDLSTLSRAERGVADEAELIDINQLTQELFDEHRAEAELKGLQLNLKARASLGSVMASRLYLKELLQNFITNAIKYTEKGGITIEASLSKSKDEVVFAISDTGLGISKADQKHIFDKFYRAEDYRTRETSGTGLGLYVAGKLARKLDTTIDFKSRLNYGSTFGFRLPLANSDTVDDSQQA